MCLSYIGISSHIFEISGIKVLMWLGFSLFFIVKFKKIGNWRRYFLLKRNQNLKILKTFISFILQKMWNMFWEHIKDVVGQQFVNEIMGVIHMSNKLSQQNPGVEMQVSRKYLWNSLLSNSFDFCNLHGRQHGFSVLYQQKHGRTKGF